MAPGSVHMRGMTKWTDYAEQQRAASTPDAPLKRLSCPAIPADAACGEPGQWFTNAVKDMLTITRGQNGIELPLALDETIGQIGKRPIAVENASVLGAFVGMVKSHDSKKVWGLAALGAMPVPHLFDVERALDRKFWLPTDRGERETFIKAAWPDIASRIAAVLSGRATPAQETLLTSIGRAGESAQTYRGANSQFRQATKIADLWGTVAAIDPVGVNEALLTGDAVELTVTSTSGVVVYASMSTPTKIKPGVVDIIDKATMDRVGTAQLVDFDFDDATGTLSGSFTPEGARTRSSGFRALQAGARGGQSFFAVKTPFTGFSAGKQSIWLDAMNAPKKTVRQVPLAVALAGARIG